MIDDLTTYLLNRQDHLDGQIDQWLSRYQEEGRKVYCARGCAACCSLAVHATAAEALHVAETLPAGRLESLERYVEKLRRGLPELSDLKHYLRRHRRELGPCPFLELSGACGIYVARPFSCRALLSTRDSAWCAIDPAELHPLEKEAFLSSLDPEVVAYPTHYLAVAGELGQEAEGDLLAEMQERWGVSLYGNLPLLVWLAQQEGLAKALSQGPGTTAELLNASGFAHPLLLQLRPASRTRLLNDN